MPLYDYATGDLPSNTKAPELDDSNAMSILQQDSRWSGQDPPAGIGVTTELMGLYLAYLVAINFLPAPTVAGSKAMPRVLISVEQREAQGKVGGRAAVA